jgi:RNA polymerase sigma factor (sigma-70 family)
MTSTTTLKTTTRTTTTMTSSEPAELGTRSSKPQQPAREVGCWDYRRTCRLHKLPSASAQQELFRNLPPLPELYFAGGETRVRATPDQDQQLWFTRLHVARYRFARAERAGRHLQAQAWDQRRVYCEQFICTQNMGLIGFVRRRERVRSRFYEFYIDAAEVALMEAVRGFDPRRDVKFSTYACQAITNRWREARREAVAKWARDNLALEGAELELGVPDGHKRYEAQELHYVLDQNLAGLNPMELQVIRYRYLTSPPPGTSGWTYAAVGRKIGRTLQRIAIAERNALEKLRRFFLRRYDKRHTFQVVAESTVDAAA